MNKEQIFELERPGMGTGGGEKVAEGPGKTPELWKKKGHPNLRGGNPPHPHTFDAKQMEALSAVCETFVPSLPLEASGLADPGNNRRNFEETAAKDNLDNLSAFYRLSAVEAGVPEKVAGLFQRRLKPFPFLLLRITLWLLSTGFGTFLLCQFICFSWRFPFFHRFSSLSLEKRERVMKFWAHSPIQSLQKMYKLTRGFIMYSFYTMVDADGRNPAWNAICYSGPVNELPEKDEPVPRPLDGFVMDGEAEGAEALRSFLANGGFTLLDDVSHLRSLSKQNESGKTIIGVSCDAVIVGSGSGGGLAAGVLAEGGQKVLILEQGQYYARDDLTLLESPTMENMYLGGGVLATECGSVNLIAGATVGGGSAVNWAASFQTPAHVRHEWAEELGLPMFSTDKYQQAMDAVCSKGEVQYECRHESFQNIVLREGCKKLGVDIGNIPRNVRGIHACGFCCMGCSKGEKLATSETWLVDAVNNGALILSNCVAQEVLHRGNSSSSKQKKREAVGVVAQIGNILVYIESRATVVACGTLSTPPLLILSGFQNPQIGRNFHCHPVLCGWGYFPEGNSFKGTVYDGPIMTAVSKEKANWQEKVAYGSLIEVPILHPGMYAALMPWLSGSDHKDRMRKYARTAHILVLTRDQGGGTVGVDKNARTTKITYQLDPKDAENMLETLELGLRALIAAGAVEIGTHHLDGPILDVKSSTPEQVDEFMRKMRLIAAAAFTKKRLDMPLSSAHQMSTCRMGADPKTSVVDESGETWEAEGLFIADASVFPTASGVNPMITVQSIAYCTAHSVLKKLQQSG